MLRRPGENVPWQPATEQNPQPHDQPMPEVQYATYFTPIDFIVLKQYVHHVELLLHEKNLPRQNHLQILCTF